MDMLWYYLNKILFSFSGVKNEANTQYHFGNGH